MSNRYFRLEAVQERRQLVAERDLEMKKLEDSFNEERSKMKEQLHEVVTNEINLLNRIKSLEAEEGYSRLIRLNFLLKIKNLL